MRYLHKLTQKNGPLSPEAQEIVDKYEALGFTGFNPIGGTSHEGDHYTSAIIHKFAGKNLEFLILPYDFKVKDPIDNTKQPGEKPMQTVIRETLEEAQVKINPNDFNFVDAATIILPAKGDKGKHTKRYGETNKYKGEVANFDHLKDKRNPIDPETGTPFWVTADVLAEILFLTHRVPVGHVMISLCSKDVKYWYALDGNRLMKEAELDLALSKNREGITG